MSTAKTNPTPDARPAAQPEDAAQRVRAHHANGAVIRETAEEAAAAIADIPVEQRYLNRELQWLEFNRRVLELAGDERTPLLERARFLGIFTTNLDEFFMKRVGGLKRQVAASVTRRSHDGMSPGEQLDAIRRVVIELQERAADLYEREVLPALAAEGLEIVAYEDAQPQEREALDQWFRRSVFPVLTPLAVDPGHRFPFISNLSMSMGVILTAPDRGDTLFARVKVPASQPKLVRTDAPGEPLQAPTQGQPLRLVLLSDVIRNNLDDLFPGMQINHVLPFRVTRNADIEHDAEDADDLIDTVETEMKQRRFAQAVRMEIGEQPRDELMETLIEGLQLHPNDVYERRGPLDYGAMSLLANLDIPRLRYEPWRSVTPPRLADEDADIFSIIRRGDLLLHHPYESFKNSTERFIKTAARDPDVLAIKQTIYRTSADSPFAAQLARAAEAGKQVACLVELRARFDEMANVERAKELEKHGVHVAYGVIGLKTHTKIALVVRHEPDAPGGLRCYAHVSTGNYNSRTADLYTDLSLLTSDPEITEDIVELFNYLTGRSRKRDYKRLLVAPATMRTRFIELIDREIEIARSGGSGRIRAKMNQLEDPAIIDKLYEASRAGVQIDLIVRGFCCLRPGVPGISENIRVNSSIGRFLEHSRIYHFGAGAEDPVEGEWFLGSADWMHRNLDHRVEAITPVLDQAARRKLHEIIDADLRDRRNAWDMRPDGSYTQRQPDPEGDPNGPETLGSFAYLMQRTIAEAQSV